MSSDEKRDVTTEEKVEEESEEASDENPQVG